MLTDENRESYRPYNVKPSQPKFFFCNIFCIENTMFKTFCLGSCNVSKDESNNLYLMTFCWLLNESNKHETIRKTVDGE